MRWVIHNHKISLINDCCISFFCRLPYSIIIDYWCSRSFESLILYYSSSFYRSFINWWLWMVHYSIKWRSSYLSFIWICNCFCFSSFIYSLLSSPSFFAFHFSASENYCLLLQSFSYFSYFLTISERLARLSVPTSICLFKVCRNSFYIMCNVTFHYSFSASFSLTLFSNCSLNCSLHLMYCAFRVN
jgi:hypothetical protein